MGARHITRRLLQSKLAVKQQKRCLHLQPHQSKQLLREFGIPVQNGKVATTAAEVREMMDQLGGKCILKFQPFEGGKDTATFNNGLKSGIRIIQMPEEGEESSSRLLGHRLKTKQISGDGIPVEELFVAEFEDCEDWYLAIALDRENYSPVVLISRSGGLSIEDTANSQSGCVKRFHFNFTKGITSDLLSRIQAGVNATPVETEKLGDFLTRLWNLFVSKDATLLEINPLACSAEGEFKCINAKFTVDDASQRRQPELFADIQADVPDELEAQKHGLVYIKMEGNIGIIVNGAGLAMATNDAIAYHGGASANFLDAGGQATKETIEKAFEIILRNHQVKVILINIYGGIIKCDMIAESIIGAAKDLGPLRVPLVVRLQGTNSTKGLRILEDVNLGFCIESGFGEAARKAVELAKSV